jgi:hypothetical protein
LVFEDVKRTKNRLNVAIKTYEKNPALLEEDLLLDADID